MVRNLTLLSNGWLQIFAALLLSLISLRGESTRTAGEWEIKAAFLFNFAKFAEWPREKLPAGEDLVIGILGDDPFKEDLEKVVAGKKVDGHKIQTRRYATVAEARAAHILFISSNEKRRQAQVLQGLKGAGVLSVSESEDFCESGGVINFQVTGSKIRFEISPRAAEAEGLKLSSKLLNVAIIKK